MSSSLIKENKKSSLKRFFHVEWGPFWILIKMLLANALAIDWKGNKKKVILKAVTSILGFAIVAAVSYLFFYLCVQFSIFSLLSGVPMSVPSIIVNILLIFSFLGSLGRVTEDLYFANDNKVLLTFPTNGNTLFLARLAVCFLNTYLKALKLEIPFLIGYFLMSGYPIYMCFVIFFVWAIIDMVLLLLVALLSVPNYYLKRFLKTHQTVNAFAIGTLIVLVLALCGFLIGIIPDKIDIFSNWGPYFAIIQSGLTFYTKELSFFFETSKVYLGGFTGFSFSYFSGYGINGLWTFLVLLALVPVLFVSCLSLASPLYLRLASGSDELQGKGKKGNEENKNVLSPNKSQLHKEFLLFVKDEAITPNYVGVFLALPLILSLVSKIFGAMDVNSRGEGMVQVASLLILLLIALSANGLIARIYSEEGAAFKLNRTYPLKDSSIIGSKLIIPSIIGIISILASVLSMAFIRRSTMESTLYMGFGAMFIYVGHLLFSAGVDFSNPKDSFGETSFLSNNENRSVILAFVTSILIAILYYYYLQDSILWLHDVATSAGFKVLLLGILYFLVNTVLYLRKIKYVYKQGESL